MDCVKRYEPEPTSAPGDFYVENNCCITCGVPQAAAPDLVGWVDGDVSHCFWKKQPTTHEEMQQAFAVFDGQELGCHRYAGLDPKIQARIGIENCDNPIIRENRKIQFDQESESGPPQFRMFDDDSFFHRIWQKITGKR
jgi:hypothetical protein